MREIKIRAWDTVQEKMLKVEVINFREDAISLDEGDNSVTDTFEMFELMQYAEVNETGTGREIYEGDIVDYDDTAVIGGLDRISQMRGVVEMSEGCWWITDDVKRQSVRLWSETAEVKIVGNIHENPDLGINL